MGVERRLPEWRNMKVPPRTRQSLGGAGSGRLCVGTGGTGGALGQDPPPPPLYTPQNGCTEQWVLWVPKAPEILF